jgi:two-component system, chemotaxis family, CheB/CheR fusion protein
LYPHQSAPVPWPMPNDVDESSIQPQRVPVVAVGASAGGITALQTFFDHLPSDLGAAVVVVVHLDPEHRSELTEILANHTKMRVVQVNEPARLEKNNVYVIPPNRSLLISGDSIATAKFQETRGHRAPIDQFFMSLAEQHGDGFAVVLSGSGSDGAVGVRAIREKGGIILVQDPAEAEYGSMPRSAMAGGADFVLPVREIAQSLPELIQRKRQVPTADFNAGDEDILRRILAYLRAKIGQDFSGYKRATILRRIARRMQVTQVERMDQYLAHLREHNDEVQALFADLLISVTSFFRDSEAFAALANLVIVPLFENLSHDKVVRAWIPACATGEEAYSIAILLLEEATRRDVRTEIQVFATDLDEQALAIAREGRYPTSISADVSEDRLRRFFAREGDHYRIRREVRDLIVFASHSLLKDPPFSHIDIVSCRNLLIYLDKDLQHQIAAILHYALAPNGFLFLGASESVDNPPGFFISVDREARIFRAIERPRDKLPMLPRLYTALRGQDVPTIARAPRVAPNVDSSFHHQALEELAPPSILVDQHHLAVNLSETSGRFIRHPSGPITSDAAEIVLPELRLELRAALHRAFEQNESTVTLPIPVRFNGTRKGVVLHVRPLRRDGAPPTALALFMEGAPIEAESEQKGGGTDETKVAAQLREELHATRTVLRTTREQYEAATEELRAANEELQSINEEYRSTAEELETSKEELQSINEELQTVNNELKLKLEMVSRAHNDLQNLMSATDVSTMFLDSQLRIERFTPRMAELFNIVPGDEGRPVTDFTHKLEYQDLMNDARRVLADLIPIERTVRTTTGRWFLIRLRPYRTLDDKIEGVVATFVDVTEQRQAEAAWEERQNLLLNELSHRVKNTLAVVGAVVRHSLRDSGASDAALEELEARLLSLAKAHELLAHYEWRGASLEHVAREQLSPYLNASPELVHLSGPSVMISPALATPLGLALHELATNAAKYGGLSVASGRVQLTWQTRVLEDGLQTLELTWAESGGPPVTPPTVKGTGDALIEHGIPGARVDRRFEPGGMVCTIVAPIAGIDYV